MITLYSGGPRFGVPDASPFCMKAEMLLKIAGLAFERKFGDLRKSPKGKVPWIVDDGETISDSTFIRMHLERRHGADFSGGYGDAALAAGWAFEKLCEEQLYWIIVRTRWLNDANFDKGPRQFFAAAPALIRGFVIKSVRKRIAKTLFLQGLGRHSQEEINQLAERGISALSDFLGDKRYFLGDRVCGADAIVFAITAGLLTDYFNAPERAYAAARPNLAAYNDRMLREFYPELAGNKG